MEYLKYVQNMKFVFTKVTCISIISIIEKQDRFTPKVV